MQKYAKKYSSDSKLKEAIKLFDFDGDGIIQKEELEYFLKNFGLEEDPYFKETQLKLLLDCAQPVDSEGSIEIDAFVKNVTREWKKLDL